MATLGMPDGYTFSGSEWGGLTDVAGCAFGRVVHERGYVESYSPMPYLLGAANAGLWCIYSLPSITGCNSKVLIANAFGVALESGYVLLFVWYAGPRRREIVLKLLIIATVVLLMIVCGTAVASHVGFTPWPHVDPPITRQSSVLGFFVGLSTLSTFCSPLAVTGEVLHSKSIEYMPLSLTLGTTACVSARRLPPPLAFRCPPLPPPTPAHVSVRRLRPLDSPRPAARPRSL